MYRPLKEKAQTKLNYSNEDAVVDFNKKIEQIYEDLDGIITKKYSDAEKLLKKHMSYDAKGLIKKYHSKKASNN